MFIFFLFLVLLSLLNPTIHTTHHDMITVKQYLSNHLDLPNSSFNTILNHTNAFHLTTLTNHFNSIPYHHDDNFIKDFRVHGSMVGTLHSFGTNWFGYLDNDRGSLSTLINHLPKPQQIQIQQQVRKRGLLAMPVSGHAKDRVASLIERFKAHDMDVFLFHYDHTDWSDVKQYQHITSVRVIGQTKFWFAKRFLVPQLLDNYDYLFLWDDDVVLDDDWSPLQFVGILQHYGIHVAQPALHSGGKRNNFQYETVRFHQDNVEAGSPGRFSEFVEIMFPVFSREAWQNCIWETIPFDGFSYWGIDNIWYPHCSTVGYCRFAIIDMMPVGHLDLQTLNQRIDKNLRELNKYLSLYKHGLCMARPGELDWISYFRSLCICNYLRHFPPGRSFRWITPIVPNIHGAQKFGLAQQTCVEPHLWPGIANKPWFADDQVDDPVPYPSQTHTNPSTLLP